MSLKIKTVARKNPLDQAAPPKYYASAISSGKVDLEGLCDRISQNSTLSHGEIFNTVISLVEEINFQLDEGKIVEVGKLGTFRLTVNSDGVATAEEVSANLVKKVNVRYRAGSDISTKVNSIKLEKVS